MVGDAAVEYPVRQQIVAERMIGHMRRAIRSLGIESDAVVVGVTDRDLYIREYTWRYALAYRADGHLSVVSTARLGRPDQLELGRVRLRKRGSLS